MTPEMLIRLGQLIKAARKSEGLSQAELASRVGTSRPSLSDYEKGRTPPGVDVVTKIANVLQTDFVVDGYFVGRRATLPPPAEQLRLPLDAGNGVTLRIEPSKDMLVLWRVRSAS